MDTNGNTKELIKDLCSRLPYGVILKTDNVFPQKLEGVSFDKDTFLVWVSDGGFTLDCMDCKPYLFPLSSMTKEQKQYIKDRYCYDWDGDPDDLWKIQIEIGEVDGLVDWFHENHFDYRCLIEKGLAIDATGLNIY